MWKNIILEKKQNRTRNCRDKLGEEEEEELVEISLQSLIIG